MLCLYFIWNKSILVFANYPKGCKCSFTFECIPPVMFGVQLHHSERHWSLASLTNNEGGWGVEALCQGSIGTHLLTLVHLYLSSYSLNTITHSVCATDGCTSGTCKLTITHTHTQSLDMQDMCDGPVTSSTSATPLNVCLFSLKQDEIERGCL